MPKATIEYPTSVINAKNNGGYHPLGKRAYRNAVKLIYDCLLTYREPRLYHLCFQGQTNKKHKAMLQALVQKIDRASILCEWFSAREIDSEKGEHLHVFMLIDSSEVRAQSILNSFEDQFLGRECLKRGILLHINPPRNEIHGNNRYAALPYLGVGNKATATGWARLNDALIWLTYIFKARGKPDVNDKKSGQVFSRSRPNRLARKGSDSSFELGAVAKNTVDLSAERQQVEAEAWGVAEALIKKVRLAVQSAVVDA